MVDASPLGVKLTLTHEEIKSVLTINKMSMSAELFKCFEQ